VPQAQIIGRRVRIIHTSFEDNWRVTPRQLEQLCDSENDVYRPRILVLNYPSNPDGGSYTSGELQKIAEIARKYDIILLSDEIYGQLHHKGEHISVARFYPEGTIISSGLSKWCGAGGWRLGTFTIPHNLDWLMETMAAMGSETYTSVSAPIQWAAVRAFKGGIRIERYLWHARRILSALGSSCVETLTAAGVRVHPPDGAFYLFPDFSPLKERLAKRGIHDSVGMCNQLLADTGVAILPPDWRMLISMAPGCCRPARRFPWMNPFLRRFWQLTVAGYWRQWTKSPTGWTLKNRQRLCLSVSESQNSSFRLTIFFCDDYWHPAQ
jgi:aspartate aminotransferase